MLTRQEIIQSLQTNKALLQAQFKVNEIALFGSYARNEQTEHSDIDVLLNLQEASYLNLCHAKYFLQSIFPQQKIQIVSKNGIKPKYFEAIKSDLIYA
ncbi:MAG: hypothetical protein RJA07_1156 [Bacteroidota bacterium]|jgi:hypothetical protein